MPTAKPGNITKIWAETGASANPGDAKYAQGWVSEIPTHEHFNFLLRELSQATVWLNEQGIGDWDSETNYQAGSSCVGTDSQTYHSVVNNNKGNNPVDPSNAGYWAYGLPGPNYYPGIVLDQNSLGGRPNAIQLKFRVNSNQPIAEATIPWMIEDQNSNFIMGVDQYGNLASGDQTPGNPDDPWIGKGTLMWQGGFRVADSTTTWASMSYFGAAFFAQMYAPSETGLRIDYHQSQAVYGLQVRRHAGPLLGGWSGNGQVASTGSLINLSDARAKENIKTIKSESIIEKFKKLKPKEYNRIGQKALEYGFVAQDIQSIFPEMICEFSSDDDDDRLGFQENQLIPVIVDVLQQVVKKVFKND